MSGELDAILLSVCTPKHIRDKYAEYKTRKLDTLRADRLPALG